MIENKIESSVLRTGYGIFDRIHSFFDEKPKRNTYAIAAMCVIVFVLMLVLNVTTPYLSDDFEYMFVIGEDKTLLHRVGSISDVVYSMKNHYNTINGRVILHGILQYVLIFDEIVFDIINSLMFTALSLLIYKHCKGAAKKSSPLLFLAVNIMLWLFLPSYGMTTLWASGSVNYLWSGVIRLTALIPYRLYADGEKFKIPSALITVLMLPLSLLAGATNENSVAAMIGMSVLFIIVYKIRKMKIPVWTVTSLICMLSGFAFTVFAPANSVRSEAFTGFKASVLFRIFSIPIHYLVYLAAPLGVFAVFWIVQRRIKKDKENNNTIIALIYIAGSVGGAGVMLASPYFPMRAWTDMAVCVMIAAGMMMYNADMSIGRFARNAAAAVMVVLSIWCAGSYIQLAVDCFEVTQRVAERESYIEEQKTLGNYDIVLPKIITDNQRSGLYSISDIAENPDNWSNVNKAKYYGVNTITAE